MKDHLGRTACDHCGKVRFGRINGFDNETRGRWLLGAGVALCGVCVAQARELIGAGTA